MWFDESRIAASPIPSRKPHTMTAAVSHSVSASPSRIEPWKK